MLALIFLVKSLSIFVFALVKSGLIYDYTWILKLPGLFTYAIPGAMFIYVRGVVKNQGRPEPTDWLHLLPMLFGLVDVLPYYLDKTLMQQALQDLATDTYLFQSWSGYLNHKLQYIIFPLLYWGYLIAILRMQKKHKLFSNYNQKSRREKWILHGTIFVVFVQLFATIQMVSFYTMPIDYNGIDFSYSFLLIQVVFLLTVILYLIYDPTVLFGHLFELNMWQNDFRKSNADTLKKITGSTKEITVSENAKSVLKNELAATYATEILRVMTAEKLYLDPHFQMSDLSNITKVPLHHCSFVLNNILNKNFRDWTNEFRVHYFIELYKKQAKYKTIEALAFESGFKNTATFYNAFKKSTHLSPSKYFEIQRTVLG
jgi:AraC-like DNA-binding protein